MKELFEGHNNLISGFNIFLPKALDISEFWRAIIMIKVKLLFCSVEFQLQMFIPSVLMMTFVPTGTLSK